MQIDGLIKMWLKSWIRSAAHVTAKGFEYRPFVSTSGIPLIHEIFIEGKDDGVIRWTKHTGLAGKTKDPGSLKIMGYHMLEWLTAANREGKAASRLFKQRRFIGLISDSRMQHFALWLSFLEGNFQNTSLFDADDITIYFRICFSAIFQNVLIDAITKNSQYYSQNSSVG